MIYLFLIVEFSLGPVKPVPNGLIVISIFFSFSVLSFKTNTNPLTIPVLGLRDLCDPLEERRKLLKFNNNKVGRSWWSLKLCREPLIVSLNFHHSRVEKSSWASSAVYLRNQRRCIRCTTLAIRLMFHKILLSSSFTWRDHRYHRRWCYEHRLMRWCSLCAEAEVWFSKLQQ